MNHVTLIGHLTKDPEIRYTSSGTCVGTFTLAVDRRVQKDKPKEADFIPCVAWGKTAEVVGNYCKKGKQVAVEGRIQTRTYDAKDGTKKYVTEVIVSHLELIGNREGGRAQGAPSGNYITDEEVPF